MHRHLLWLLALPLGSALGQPIVNRDLHTISVVPDPDGPGAIVAAHWTVEVSEPASVPIDVSTRVELCVNGVPVTTVDEIVIVDPGSGAGCAVAPPCGGACGSATLNGESVSLDCFEAECESGTCVCDCGVWITTTFPAIDSIAPGDDVKVTLLKLFGSSNENDDTDNGVDGTYDEALGWNRSAGGAEALPVAPGLFDVHVALDLAWENFPVDLNLDTDVSLAVNGAAVDARLVPITATQASAVGCPGAGCGPPCGTLNDATSACAAAAPWPCACAGSIGVVFASVVMSVGDELAVTVSPAPGALPELMGFTDDDIVVSTVVSVGAGTPERPATLARPNPFAARTSVDIDVARPGRFRVSVYDAAGRRVRDLLDRPLARGTWSVSWDGRDRAGERVPPGAYWIEVRRPDGTTSARVTRMP